MDKLVRVQSTLVSDRPESERWSGSPRTQGITGGLSAGGFTLGLVSTCGERWASATPGLHSALVTSCLNRTSG